MKDTFTRLTGHVRGVGGELWARIDIARMAGGTALGFPSYLRFRAGRRHAKFSGFVAFAGRLFLEGSFLLGIKSDLAYTSV